MPAPRYRSTAEFLADVNRTFTSRRTSADKILTPQEIAAQLTALAGGSGYGTEDAEALAATLRGEISGAGETLRTETRPRGARTVVLGDSIDASIVGWFPYVAVLSKKINVIRNAGIGGNRTDQMLARIDTDVLAHKPDIVILGSSTNDYSAGFTEAQTRGNITAMVGKIIAAGATPVFRTTAPVDTAASAALYNTPEKRRQAVIRHNAWLHSYGAARGIHVLDVYPAVADLATGGFKAGMTTDGVHPLEVGYRAMADHLLAAGLPPVFTGGFALARAVTDDTNLLKNGIFVGDANNDGLADGWLQSTGAASATKSLNPGAAPVVGNWQRVATDGVTGVAIVQDVTTAATDSLGQPLYTVGDTVEFVGRVRTGGGAPVMIRVATYDAVPSGSQTPVYNTTTAIEDGIFSVRTTITPGITKIRAQIGVGPVGGSSAPGWVEVAEVAIRNLTRLGAL